MVRSKRKSFIDIRISEEEKLISDIKDLFITKGVIPYLIAHPGVGKTSIIKKINPNYLIYNVTLFNEEDLIEEQPVWYTELVNLSNRCDSCLIVFDDFDKLNYNLQKYFFGLTSKEKNINNLIIPLNANVLLCGVSEEYTDCDYMLDFKLNSYLKRIEMKVKINEWIHWANNNDVNNIIKSYLNENPNDLIKDVKDNNKYSHSLSLTPKSWSTRINDELYISSMLGIKPNLDYYMDSKTKDKFLEYMNKFNELNIQDIIDGKITVVDKFKYNSSDISFITNALIVSVYRIEEIQRAISFLNKVGYREYKDLFLSLWSNINDNNEDLLNMKNAILNVHREEKRNEK